MADNSEIEYIKKLLELNSKIINVLNVVESMLDKSIDQNTTDDLTKILKILKA